MWSFVYIKTLCKKSGKIKRVLHQKSEFDVRGVVEKVLKNANLYYSGIELEYSKYRNCQEYGCDSICRCSRITDIKITDIDENYIVERLIGKFKDSFKQFKFNINENILYYCLDRILRILVRDEDNYYIDYGPGYYGDEIDGVHLDAGYTTITILFNKNKDIEAIKYALELEYGYILEKIDDTKFCEVKEVDINNVIVANNEYYSRLNKNRVDFYKNYNGPICLCHAKSDDKYHLIDGYHRYVANKDNQKIKIVVIE